MQLGRGTLRASARRAVAACGQRRASAAACAAAQQQHHTALGEQERISADGSLTTNAQRAAAWQQQQHQQQQLGVGATTSHRPPSLPAAAPAAAPVPSSQLDALVQQVLAARRVVALTGAGVSTESNIPDYRGPSGAYTTGFTPMTHQQFMAKPENRARYWARSFAGWHEFADVQPNAAHEGLARLQARGWVQDLVTQNVDRLHHKALQGCGSRSQQQPGVLELHGTTHRVVCMGCGAESCRHELQQRLAQLNPELAARVRAMSTAGSGGIRTRGAWERALRAGTAADSRKVAAGQGAEQVPVRRPDGDVELVDAGTGFTVAPCSACGSDLLKPDVVFFGDSVPKQRVASALEACCSADLLLVVGSSLMVWSAFRLVKAAKEAGAALAIVNVGPTRADHLADLKLEALAGEALMRAATHPALLLPRAAAAASC